MIRLASQSFDCCSNSLHTSLRLFLKRLVWPAAINPQCLTPYSTEVERVRSIYTLTYTSVAKATRSSSHACLLTLIRLPGSKIRIDYYRVG